MRCISFSGSLISFFLMQFFVFAAPASATGYGVFDPRSMGMGGAAVAAGNAEQAHAYNAALLSFYDESENYSDNGRIIHPFVSAQVSEGGRAAVDIIDDELDEALSAAVSLYNGNLNDVELAQSLLTSLTDLESALAELDQNVIEVDAYTGLVISEPAEREGGSFYFHIRGMAFGQANITQEDLALLSDQINTIVDVVNGNVGGTIIDPVPLLTSEGSISSLLIGEWGLAMAKEFPVWNFPVSFGITPKIMQVEVYTEDINFTDDIPSYSENSKRHLFMNFDVGVATEFLDNFRAGFSVRNVISKSLESENNLAVNLKPRARLGLAYINDFMTIGLDFDVEKNEPVASEPESQEVALGVEFHPWETIVLRAGYMQDSAGEKDDVVSAGIRYQIWRLGIEAAFATSNDITGGSILIGWKF